MTLHLRWYKTMNRGGSGNDNDEIAASPPIWMDIDGENEPEIVVAFVAEFSHTMGNRICERSFRRMG